MRKNEEKIEMPKKISSPQRKIDKFRKISNLEEEKKYNNYNISRKNTK